MILGGKTHTPVTVLDGTTINFTLSGQQITAETIDSAINHNSLLNTHNLTTDIDHGSISGLSDDDHSQYFLLAGRSGGQTAYLATGSGEGGAIYSTSNATKGVINLGDTAYVDEVNNRLGIGTSTPAEAIDLGTSSLLTTETNITQVRLTNLGLALKNIYTGGGWARTFFSYRNSSDTPYFGFGGRGSGQNFTRAWIGPAFNDNWITMNSTGVGINTDDAAVRSQFQVNVPTTANSVYNTTSQVTIHGISSQSGTNEILLRLNRGENVSNFYPGTVDFKLGSYGSGGAGDSFAPKSKLTIALKAASSFNEGAEVDVLFLRSDKNMGLGTGVFGTSAANVFALANGTEPTTSPADIVQLYSVDLSAGNATLGIRTETAVTSSAAGASDAYLNIRVNGTTYKLLLHT